MAIPPYTHSHTTEGITMSTLLSATSLANALSESAEYRELVLAFEAKAKEALTQKHYVEALGKELSLPEVAMFYQGLKGIPKDCFANEEARKASFAYQVSTECLAIIKKAGYKADWQSISAITKHA